MNELETYILISIRKRFTHDILAGHKRLELRTFPIPLPYKALIYECGPDSRRAIIGMCAIGRGQAVTPDMLQETIKDACVTRDEFNAYAHPCGKEPRVIYRHQLWFPVSFKRPMPLAILGIVRPPQSWQYITAEKQIVQAYMDVPQTPITNHV